MSGQRHQRPRAQDANAAEETQATEALPPSPKKRVASRAANAAPVVAPHKEFTAHPAARARAADLVFESLSRAILSGELVPGSSLPPQRELSIQFDVSPLVVRQAMHRLEDMGLLRVRQGGASTVLDPNAAADLRLLQLRFALAKPGDALALAALEAQALSMLQLLVLCQRRITAPELAQLERTVSELQDGQPFREALGFRLRFSEVLSRATRNPLFVQNVRWWATLMKDLEARTEGGGDPISSPRVVNKAFYYGLIKTLREGRGAPEYWLKMLKDSFDWTEAQLAHPIRVRSALGKPRAR